MTTKTQKRTLLKEDLTIWKQMTKDLVKLRPSLQKMKNAYLDLELGEFSNEIFHDATSNRTAVIRKKYITGIEKELSATGIKSSVVIQPVLNNAENQFNEFLKSIEAVKNFEFPRGYDKHLPKLKLKHITYYDYDAFEIAQEDQEEILEEHCRLYLEGDQEHETHRKVKNFLEVFEDLTDHFDKIGYQYASALSDRNKGLSTIASSFFDFQGEKITIKPNSIRWAVSGQKQQIEERKKRGF
ncbi:hypothetical protein SAMN04488033_1454 [Salegentibacter agarivorans]|uniref:Uncharacterized protein n=1 Tax=Salegentibacter agarivorans TaxID=345907 RepID=A0A1I2QDU4_9FLAO|nr:hypothetical protein [Salegentibacter agarivorans]SFG23936.1 hypothetical protein SAMN04488033_1454 [Salegentibacter agarivorans]